MKTYIAAWDDAFRRYQNREQRPGYLFGWMSRVRHSYALYPALREFKKELSEEKDKGKCKNIIKKWLQDPRLKQNDHSFRSYLLDELQKNFKTEGWRDTHPLIFYTDIVYRGTHAHPDVVFKNGFTSKIKDVRAYACLEGNGSIGISTSKSPGQADGYQRIIYTLMGAVNMIEGGGYVYQINLRKKQGIDLHTMYLRIADEKNVYHHSIMSKQEVNVIGSIAPEDIMGYGIVQNGQYIEQLKNPAYQANKDIDNENVQPLILERLFGKS
jgi:hypothetical protein